MRVVSFTKSRSSHRGRYMVITSPWDPRADLVDALGPGLLTCCAGHCGVLHARRAVRESHAWMHDSIHTPIAASHACTRHIGRALRARLLIVIRRQQHWHTGADRRGAVPLLQRWQARVSQRIHQHFRRHVAGQLGRPHLLEKMNSPYSAEQPSFTHCLAKAAAPARIDWKR